MINNTTVDSVRVSLIDTKVSNKSKKSYCQKMFQNCFLHLFFKKKEKNFLNSNQDSKISKSYDEKYHTDSLEIHYNPKKDCKLNQKSLFTKYKVEDYEQNQIFIMEGAITKKPILLKITENYFQGDYENSDCAIAKLNVANTDSFISSLAQNEKLTKQLKKIPICFPNKFEQIKYNVDYLYVSDLPSRNFADYLANKIQGNLILDFTGGIGEYTIPIANKCDFVISCSNNPFLTTFNQSNSELYGINNVEFINFFEEDNINDLEKFLIIKNKNNKADVIIINPNNILRDFSSKKINDNYLKRLLRILSQNSKSFILILPKHFQNFEGLADLLAEGLKNGDRCGFEIEKIFTKNKLKHLVVYYGLISTIKGSEEMAFMHNLLENYEEKNLNNSQNESQKNTFRCISNQISNNYGNMYLLDIIATAIKNYPKEKSQNIYSYMLTVFKKNSFQIENNETPKNYGHELGMVKCNSTNFEKKMMKPILTKTISSNFVDINETCDDNCINSKPNQKSDCCLNKLERKNNRLHPKLNAIKSFENENIDIISDYSKSFVDEDEEKISNSYSGPNLNILKRSESGLTKIVSLSSQNNAGTNFNSLNEKALI